MIAFGRGGPTRLDPVLQRRQGERGHQFGRLFPGSDTRQPRRFRTHLGSVSELAE
jgi:hypothetical protein